MKNYLTNHSEPDLLIHGETPQQYIESRFHLNRHHTQRGVYQEMQGDPPVTAPCQPASFSNHTRAASTDARRVLVVDDEDYIADLLVEVLSDEGMEALVAYDGYEGLHKAQAQHPDLVISDIMMPGMSGLQLVDALRSRRPTAQIPILLISAGAPPPPEYLDIGFVRKPFDLTDILSRVEYLLQHPQPARSPRSGQRM